MVTDRRLGGTRNALWLTITGLTQGEHVTGGQCAARRTAEAAERERRGAAQKLRNSDATGDQDVDPHPGVRGRAHGEGAGCGYGDGTPLGNGAAVHGHQGRCTGDADQGLGGEMQGRAGKRRFQSRCAFRVSDSTITQTEREVVHRARRWHTHLPVSGTPRPILHRCQHAGRRHPHGAAAHRLSTTIRTGVGSKPLHGLLICGQFDTSTKVSTSARSLILFPGAERPSTMPRVPSSSTGTFM